MPPKDATPTDDRLDEIADELYGTPPDEFVARRDELAKELTAASERKLAAEVRKLRKPTVSAWAVNLLVRARREEVESFVELGPALAEAQRELDGEALRTLSVQRQRIVQALVQAARDLAAEAGHPLGAGVAYEVESTLHAALADPKVAERVLAGRLVKPESYAGFGPDLGGFGAAPQLRLVEERDEAPARTTGEAAPKAEPGKAAEKAAPSKAAEKAAPSKAAERAAPSRAAQKAAARQERVQREREQREQLQRERDQAARRAADRRTAERRRLENAVAEARTALDDAEGALAEATSAADAAEDARGELREQASYLREQLADIERRIAETDLDRRRLKQVAERAKNRVARAAQQVEAAESRLARQTP
jgi:hypothetical protein